ncbi:MAG: alpha/beta hydrolase-fold protein [Candidatus Wallbacteria bacterium]|nr:alpha/beta hydrolase-fold protein [Candidatus Wallbacteria bacterium]
MKPFLLLAVILSGGTAMAFNVTFSVTAPAGTEKLFITGNCRNLGDWNPGQVEMTKTGQVFQFSTTLEGKIEYKYTKGSWDGVEKDGKGQEIGNRTLEITADMVIKDAVAVFSDTAKAKPKKSLTGSIELIETLKYKLIVYLPPGYRRSKKNYPVFYLQDGQNLFDASTSFMGVEWGCDETAEKLIKLKKVEPLIMVGIYNSSERISDYTAFPDQKNGGGKADPYLDFIVKSAMPFINSHYRVKSGPENCGIGGSSLGGIFSLYAAFSHPELFGKCAVISPSLWWADRAILKWLSGKGPGKIWLDMGDQEGEPGEEAVQSILNLRSLKEKLIGIGYAESDLSYLEVKNAAHNEAAWAARFDRVLSFLFPALE